MSAPGDELPEDLENELYEAHFQSSGDERQQRIDALCGRHPDHADAMRHHARALARGEQLLGPAHEELLQASEQQRIGPFEVKRVLGEGGFGTVYLAHQEQPVRRQVALKVLRRGQLDARSRQRFEDERHLLARLQHANIAHIYDAGVTEEGHQFFAMEFVEGVPITEWRERTRPDIETELRLFLRVCNAIHHAHQRSVVHRDLKPSNVLVASEDDAPTPKVIDFGIAKLIESDVAGREHTLQGAQVGTPGYMSPEQANGEEIDTRTDVYSLGILLCELLTGELPFDREQLRTSSFVALARMLKDAPPRRPSAILAASAERDPDLDRRLRTDLDWIVLRAIAADRDARYTSVAALAEDIERHLAGEPVLARKNVASYVIGKFVRRHRLVVTSAMLLLAATIVTISLLVWGLGEVESARQTAEQQRDVAQARDMAARMAVSQLAMADGDVATALGYLEDVPEDRRNWEWRHLAARCDASTIRIDIERPLLDVAWLDDERVITFPMKGDIHVWNVETREIEWTFQGWQKTFRRAVVDRSSSRVLIAADHTLSLWNTETGERIRELHKLPQEAFALAWSNDRRTAAVGGRGRWLDLVPIETGEARRRLKLETSPTAVTFLGDGELLVGDATGAIRRIDIASEEVLQVYEGHRDVVETILLHPDRAQFFTASVDSTVRAWKLSATESWAVQRCSGRMRQLVLSTDGELLYGCGGWVDSPLSVWGTRSFDVRGRYFGHRSGIGSVALSPDGTRIASGSRDKTLRVWSSEPPSSSRVLDAGIDARVLAVDRERTRFGTASMDGRVQVWNARTLERELSLQHDEAFWTGCAIDDEHIYVAGRTVRAYRLADGSEAKAGKTNGRRIENMLVSADGRWLVGGHHRRMVVWSLPDLEVVHDLEHAVGALRMQHDPNSNQILMGCAESLVRWFDPATGSFVRDLQIADRPGHIGALSRQDDLLVAGAWKTLRVYRDGQLERTIDTRNVCSALSPDSSRLVTGASDNKVRLWDLTTGNQLLVFPDPIYTVSNVQFVGGGEHIIALSHRWEAPTQIHVWTAPMDAELPR